MTTALIEKKEIAGSEKLDFRLIPIYETEKLFESWKYLTEGFEMVLNHSCGDSSIEKILNEIMGRKLLLWIGFLDGKYCGFVTTRFDFANAELAKIKKYLSIIHLFIKKGADKEVFVQGLEELKKFATKNGFDALRMWTPRKGWERRLEPLGWKQAYIEYNLDLKEEDKT